MILSALAYLLAVQVAPWSESPSLRWEEDAALPRMSADLDAAEFLPPPVMRTETRDLDFTFGVHAVEWAMFGSRKTIHSGGSSWKLSADNALGVGFDMKLRIKDVWFEQFFDYSFVVLGTPEELNFRTIGLNVGMNYFNSDSERMAFFAGVLMNYARLDLEENGAQVPGELEPTIGGQIGVKYMRILRDAGNNAPKIGFSADAALRYVRLHFKGDPGVSNERIGGPGLVITLGLDVQF